MARRGEHTRVMDRHFMEWQGDPRLSLSDCCLLTMRLVEYLEMRAACSGERANPGLDGADFFNNQEIREAVLRGKWGVDGELRSLFAELSFNASQR